MKKAILLFYLFPLFIPSFVYADSQYVLPYPSAMPGSTFYRLNLIKEKIEKYWYFGNFSQFHYNLKQSDKYLVEAKTLFEYKQYLLGYRALEKSNSYFQEAPAYLKKASEEGKDSSEKSSMLSAAAEKHREALQEMKQKVPESFNWTPEEAEATRLELHKIIDEAVKARELTLPSLIKRG